MRTASRRAILTALLPLVIAASLAAEVLAASAGSQERAAAAAAVPLPALTPTARRKIQAVIERPTLFHSMPAQAIDCDPDLFVFLARYPEVLVGVWDAMGITQVQARRTGPYQLSGTDGAGTTCQIDLVYGTSELHVYYATGRYEGGLLTAPVTGQAVCVLHTGYAQSASGRSTVTGRMDVFMQLGSLGADLVARTLQPLIWKSAETNFSESAKFVSQLSQASEMNPTGMQRFAQSLPQVDPPVRQRLAELALQVAERSGNGIDPADPQTTAAAARDPEVDPAELLRAATWIAPEKEGPALRR